MNWSGAPCRTCRWASSRGCSCRPRAGRCSGSCNRRRCCERRKPSGRRPRAVLRLLSPIRRYWKLIAGDRASRLLLASCGLRYLQRRVAGEVVDRLAEIAVGDEGIALIAASRFVPGCVQSGTTSLRRSANALALVGDAGVGCRGFWPKPATLARNRLTVLRRFEYAFTHLFFSRDGRTPNSPTPLPKEEELRFTPSRPRVRPDRRI